ncbi:MAG: TrkH family potassium uptake protein [Candidatus Natronoplasma sp.]
MKWIYHKEDYFLLLRELGVLLLLVSVLMLIPLAIGYLYQEVSAYRPFIYGVLTAGGMGLFFRLSPKNTNFERKHAIGLVVLAWPVISFPSALPIYLTDTAPTYLDAYFEAISGWTTTGLSTIGGNADLFLQSINLWRHMMQYFGGLGIIIMGIVVLVPLENWEMSSELAVVAGKHYRIVPSLNNTLKIITGLYLALLGIGSVAFLFSGLSLFDSVCHAMAGLSTGGFSTRSASLGAYHSLPVTLVSIPIMILGGTNFVLLYHLLSGDIKEYLPDIETKVFWITLLSFISTLIVWFSFKGGVDANLSDIIFMITSALTTTGWSTVPSQVVFLQWAPLALLFIIVAMMIGANSSSTGGGIKAYRAGLMIKNIYWITKDMVMPDSVKFKKGYKHIHKNFADHETLQFVTTFVLLYFLVLFLSFLVFAIYDYPILTSFYEVTSAIGTVGLSSGITSVGMERIPKLVLIINMWMGRIEILPILYFLKYLSFGDKKVF